MHWKINPDDVQLFSSRVNIIYYINYTSDLALVGKIIFALSYYFLNLSESNGRNIFQNPSFVEGKIGVYRTLKIFFKISKFYYFCLISGWPLWKQIIFEVSNSTI